MGVHMSREALTAGALALFILVVIVIAVLAAKARTAEERRDDLSDGDE